MIFDLDRLKAAVAAVVRELFPNLRFFGAYRYRVAKAEGRLFSGKPESAALGLPDLVDVPIRGPSLGGSTHVKLAEGSSVVIMFCDGDPTQPFLAFADDATEPTQSGLKAGADLLFTVGDLMKVNGASDFVALAQKVATELAAIKAYNDTHAHPTPWGPSGPPLAPMPAANSTACEKLKTD